MYCFWGGCKNFNDFQGMLPVNEIRNFWGDNCEVFLKESKMWEVMKGGYGVGIKWKGFPNANCLSWGTSATHIIDVSSFGKTFERSLSSKKRRFNFGSQSFDVCKLIK